MEGQNSGSTVGMPNEYIVSPGNQLSPMDTLGFCANVFGVLQFAGFMLGKPAWGLYVSSRPNKESLNELCEILQTWKGVLNNLGPEQKAQFEIDHPGEFNSMMKAIDEYEERLEDLNFDLRQNPWARYLPKTQLSRTFGEVSDRVRTLDREYNVTTRSYRRMQGGNRGPGQAAGNTAPALNPAPATGNTDDVEMIPVHANAAADERRLIDQDTIHLTERYRHIIRVCANYSMPPNMQGPYLAIQNFVTSLLSRPENSVIMMPPV